jgi:hypothetical protein
MSATQMNLAKEFHERLDITFFEIKVVRGGALGLFDL